jgi:hypothetical protein
MPRANDGGMYMYMSFEQGRWCTACGAMFLFDCLLCALQACAQQLRSC